MEKVSEVQIVPMKPSNGLIGFASCVYDEAIYLGNIGIYTSPSTRDGFRLTFPFITLPTGKKINCFYPINKQSGELIKSSIINKFEDVMNKKDEVKDDGSSLTVR